MLKNVNKIYFPYKIFGNVKNYHYICTCKNNNNKLKTLW